jgi:GAF domain-containing protein
VLAGRTDPAQPFFTAHGSFWSNDTTALLAGTTDADRQAHMRHQCNAAGYESVALIPLRVGPEVFGLLQFNDRRTNRFTPDTIPYFERMADGLAMALIQRQSAEALAERCAELERFNHVAIDRELRMIELKQEINALLTAAGHPPKYKIVTATETP